MAKILNRSFRHSNKKIVVLNKNIDDDDDAMRQHGGQLSKTGVRKQNNTIMTLHHVIMTLHNASKQASQHNNDDHDNRDDLENHAANNHDFVL